MSQKILLVEDSDDIRVLFRTGLEQAGFQVIEAVDGLEMISIAQLHEVNAIVMDIGMPRIDGISALRTVKAMSQHRSDIVIVVTAMPDPKLHQRAYEAGATELLVKPVDPHQITEALRRHLQQDLEANRS